MPAVCFSEGFMKRIYKWDNLKFILILLVVIGHFFYNYADANPIFLTVKYFIYSFHMPLFILVSGMFAKHTVNADRLDFRKVLPYFFIAVIVKALNHGVCLLLGEPHDFSLTCETGLPWYMIAVGTWIIVTHLIKNISPAYMFAVSVITGLLAGLDSNIGAQFCLSRILVFYPFFLLGYYLDSEKVFKLTNNLKVKIAAAVTVAAVAAVSIVFSDGPHTMAPLLSGQHSYSDLPVTREYGILLRLALYIVSALMCFAVIALVPDKKFFFTKRGASTLPVYCLHYLFVYVFEHFDVLPRLLKLNFHAGSALYLLIAVALTFLLSSSFISKPFSLLFKPKERQKNSAPKAECR